MSVTRRSVLIGAGLATATPALVHADGLLRMPLVDPLSKAGILAAEKWAVEGFDPLPGARVKFANGDATRWMRWACMSRSAAPLAPKETHTAAPEKTYAVAIEVISTDGAGRCFVTSIPIDGARHARELQERDRVAREAWERALAWRSDRYSDDAPF